MKMTCLIVDDEPVARQGIEEYVSQVDYLEPVASCENVAKAAVAMNECAIDVLYLDIHMPKVSGMDFLKALRNPPLTILTTAYSAYALEGYTLNVVDYLLKPVTFDRFLRATQKAWEICQYRKIHRGEAGMLTASLPYFFVKAENRYEKIQFDDVRFIEALQNYVVIHTKERKIITYLTLSGIESQLPRERFIKVHKSFVVSLASVQSIDGNEIVVAGARIPISRNLKDEVLGRILGNNLLRR